MTVASPTTSKRSALAPLAVLVGSLLVTGASTSLFFVTARGRDTARFEGNVQATQDRILGHLNSDITLLRGAAGFFGASGFVTRDEFRLYVERLDLRRYDPGVQGVGFAQRIPFSERASRVERARADGLPSFRIWPEGTRPEYHAILYLEPADPRNEAVLGFDMFTEPHRRAAMERAWLSGEPTLSGRVLLKQEISEDKQAGFLLYVPVYRGGLVPPTEAERRERLEGFVYSPFRAEDLFTGIFPPAHSLRLLFRVYDGPEVRPAQLLYDSATAEEKSAFEAARFVRTSRIVVAGRPWTIVFTSSPTYETWFGVRPEQVVGRTVREFIGEEAYAKLQEPLAKALAGEAVRDEGTLTRQEGQLLYTQSSYIPERDERGQVRGIVVLAFDITERRRRRRRSATPCGCAMSSSPSPATS